MKRIIQILVIATILGVAAKYWFWPSEPTGPTRVGEKFLFAPDSATLFVWKVEGKEFRFQRANPQSDWTPSPDTRSIQSKLNALASLQVQEVRVPNAEVEIEIGFAGGTTWKGVYGGRIFAWTFGPQKGQGFAVDAQWAPIFEEGEWSFANHTWNWCTARPASIKYAGGERNFTLFADKGRWRKDQYEFLAKEVDATTVEKWLGANCQIEVQFFRDLKRHSVNGAASASLQMKFVDGKEANWEYVDSSWKVGPDFAVMSRQLDTAMEQLINLPVDR